MLKKAIPLLPCFNINDTIDFFELKLSFKAINYGNYAVLTNNATEIHIFLSNEKNVPTNMGCLIMVENIEDLYTKYCGKGLIFLTGQLTDKPWGMKEFTIKDNNNNLLRFAQKNRMEHLQIRKIERKDNESLAAIIRTALTEFGAAKPGTVYFDPTTDDLYTLFSDDKGVYFVAEWMNELVGGCGIYHTNGLEEDTCELVKLYLTNTVRGKGIAKQLMQQCLDKAKELGYKKVYLETMPELTIAVPIYEKFGFTYLDGSLGNSGHNGCNIWMLKILD